jgi:outer membrane immunogenic protein
LHASLTWGVDMRCVWVLAWVLSAGSAFAQDAGDYQPPEYNGGSDGGSESGSSWFSNGDSYDWAGSYLGVTAAGALGQHETVGMKGVEASGDDLNGTAFGFHAGQNYQMTALVLGTEMDVSKANMSGDFDMPGSLIACTGTHNCEASIGFYGSLRGRAGVSVGRFLPYVTAGLGAASVDSHYTGPGVDTNVNGYGLGWVAGAGLEFAPMEHLVLRGEVLHYELSDVSKRVLGMQVSTDPAFTVVRAGASLKF